MSEGGLGAGASPDFPLYPYSRDRGADFSQEVIGAGREEQFQAGMRLLPL